VLADSVRNYAHIRRKSLSGGKSAQDSGHYPQAGQGGASVLDKRIDLAYNNLDQLTGLTRSGNLTGTPLVATTDFTYDPGDRLQTWTHSPNGQSPLSYGLSYDPGDRVTQLTQPNSQSSSYSYDRANQVTGATHSFQGPEGFSYDGAGNRTNPGYTTGPNNELLSDGTYTYTNDEEGNRLTRAKPGESTTYEWDYRNRLTRLVITTPTQTVDAHYTYDVFDHRIGKVVTTTQGMSQTTQATRYVYDGDAIALEFDTTNPMAPALTHRYLRAVDQLFADEQLSTMGPGALYWPLTDYQGSVRELLDASGAVVKQYRYDSFGVRSVVSGSGAVDEFFAYTGQARDPESGLQQHWHRYYDPPTGRWVSVDPVPDDTNRYRYVRNGPANATDPQGLQAEFQSYIAGVKVWFVHKNNSTNLKYISNVKSNTCGTVEFTLKFRITDKGDITGLAGLKDEKAYDEIPRGCFSPYRVWFNTCWEPEVKGAIELGDTVELKNGTKGRLIHLVASIGAEPTEIFFGGDPPVPGKGEPAPVFVGTHVKIGEDGLVWEAWLLVRSKSSRPGVFDDYDLEMYLGPKVSKHKDGSDFSVNAVSVKLKDGEWNFKAPALNGWAGK
jgi:RHS repeat-associated protein